MSFTSKGSAGAAGTAGADSSLTIHTGGTIDVGDLAILCVSRNNISDTDGNTDEILSVADQHSNTWQKAREFCKSGGAENAGVTVAVFYSVVATQIQSGDTIVVSFASSSGKRAAASVWNFGRDAERPISVVFGVDLADAASDPGLLNVSSLQSNEYLFVRAIGSKSSSASQLSPTSGFTAIDGARSSFMGSNNITLRGEFQIATAAEASSDPTFIVTDHASALIVIEEAAA